MAELIRIYPENPDPRRIKQVVDTLHAGGLVIYPTDTVYGLGCDITNYKAVEALCRIKHVKPEKANFSFICHDLSNLAMYARQIDNASFKILRRVLPGPYTFILPAGPALPLWPAPPCCEFATYVCGRARGSPVVWLGAKSPPEKARPGPVIYTSLQL